MANVITSFILALTIAVTSVTAAPVQAAENRDFGRFLAGVVALGIIAAAIDDKNNSSKNKTARSYNSKKTSKNSVPYYGYKQKGRYIHPRVLPAQCHFQARTSRGLRDVYGKQCLQDVMHNAKGLPKNCVHTVNVRHGRSAEVYSAQCLTQHGYRTNARYSR